MTPPNNTDSVELNDQERGQITACIINTIKGCKPEETEAVIDALLPIVKKLKRTDGNPDA
jgi:hypothetical protein